MKKKGGKKGGGLLGKMKSAARKASFVGAAATELQDGGQRRGSVMHAMKMDLGHNDPNKPMHERTKNASRLMTANMGGALDRGLTMDEVDANYSMATDPAWQARERKMREAREHAAAGQASRGGKHGGRRMSQADISAAIKKKQEATKNIRTHANQTIKELDKAVLNLNKNRKIAQERIDADQQHIDNLNDELARIAAKKAVIQASYDERMARRARLIPYLEEMERQMGVLCSRTSTLTKRHETRSNHAQMRFAEGELEATRGYRITHMSLAQADLLPQAYRRTRSRPHTPSGPRSITWSGGSSTMSSSMSSMPTPQASGKLHVLKDSFLK